MTWKFELTYNIVNWVLIGVTLVAIIARTYVRIYIRGDITVLKSWRWSDILLILTWLGFLSTGIMQIIPFAAWGFDGSPEFWGSWGTPNFEKTQTLGTVLFLCFWFWIFVIKLAMLCFLNEFICREYHFKSWVAIRIVFVIVVIGGVSNLLYSALWCRPLTRYWKGDSEKSCYNEKQGAHDQIIYRQIWHITTDVLVIAIPLGLLPNLKNVPNRAKIGAAIMFAIGLFCTLSALIFTLGVTAWDSGLIQAESAMTFIRYEPMIELASAIIIQCIPSLRVLIMRKDLRPLSIRQLRELRGSESGPAGSKCKSSQETTSQSQTVSTKTKVDETLDKSERDEELGNASPPLTKPERTQMRDYYRMRTVEELEQETASDGGVGSSSGPPLRERRRDNWE